MHQCRRKRDTSGSEKQAWLSGRVQGSARFVDTAGLVKPAGELQVGAGQGGLSATALADVTPELDEANHVTRSWRPAIGGAHVEALLPRRMV